jgi:hypothetical protein
MFKFNFIILTLISVSFFGCEKENNQDDTNYNISSIKAGTEYPLGDTIFIQGTITSLEDLNGFHIEIKNSSANDSIVFQLTNSNISKSFSVDTFWINDVNVHSDMLFMAFADEDGNEEKDDEDEENESLLIPFHCHPM